MFQNILIWGAHETGTLLADDIMGNVMSLQKPPVVKPSLSLAQLIYHCNPPTETIAINQMNKLKTCMFSECPIMVGPRKQIQEVINNQQVRQAGRYGHTG